MRKKSFYIGKSSIKSKKGGKKEIKKTKRQKTK